METNTESRLGASLSVVRALWRRRKWLAIAAFGASCAATLGVVAFLPNVYRSTAIVLVERQQVPEGFVRPSVTGDLETRLYTVSQEILSRGRLQALIERFTLYPERRPRTSPESLVELMRRDIQLSRKGAEAPGGPGATIAFSISYRGRDAATVAQVTNTLASFYVEENTKVRERQASGTAEFLRGQVAEMQKRLEEQERRLRDVKARHMGELPEQVDANRAAVERYASQLRVNSEAQFRARERREAMMRRLMEGGPTAAPEDPAARLFKLRRELAELQTRYTEKYPDVVRAKAEIAALERQLSQMPPAPKSGDSELTGRRQSTLNDLDAELKGLQEEEQRLQQTIATYQRRVENAPRSDQEMKAVSRDYETTKELYFSMLKRQEDAQLAETMEQRQKGEFRILDPALPSERPVAPNRLVLAFMGLVASIGAGVAAAILAERFDTSFHTTEDLRAFTRVPVLASIPRIVTPADTARRLRRFSAQAIAVTAALALIVGAAYYLATGNEQLAVMLTRGG
jgi:polysaccharide chain length determinant protein (PEP-CTERM system associated)